MEENVLFSNIAAIISKDLLIDQSNNLRKPKHFLTSYDTKGNGPRFPLLEEDDDDDDEAFRIFLQQQQEQQETSDGKSHSRKRRAAATVNKTYVKRATSSKPEEDSSKHSNNVHVVTITRKRVELNLLNEFEPNDFEGHLHLSKMTFLKIFQNLRYLLLRTTFPISVQTVFSLSLWKLTTDEHFEEIARKFHIPLNECHQIIRQFWHLISDNYEAFIKWPNSQQTQQSTLMDFQVHAQLKTFPNLFGIVAMKHLDIFLGTENEEVSVVLQIICNADQQIIDCCVELTQDYNFDTTPIGQTLSLNAQTIPPECYLIGDKSFPLKHYLMRPFEVECFRNEDVFNRMLEPATAIAQEVLDTMAKRFNMLYALEAKDLAEVRQILETVCSLHNLCVDIEDDYVERKRELKFNWASSVGETSLREGEQNQLGVKRRYELIETIVK